MFSIYYWVIFFVTLSFIIFLDLTRDAQNIKSLKIFLFTLLLLVLLMSLIIYMNGGIHQVISFILAYCTELALSVDNVFIFIIIFKYLNIESRFQHKILCLGVIGAIFFRLIIILFGSYHFKTILWLSLPIGLLLIFNGFSQIYYTTPLTLKYGRLWKFLRVSHKKHDGQFILIHNNKIFLSKLGLALILIEKTDLLFALDSISVILAITNDSFIIFSSNILAILGLRSIYFLISNAIKNSSPIKYSISCMLIFLGIKIFLGYFGIYIANTVCVIIQICFICFIASYIV